MLDHLNYRIFRPLFDLIGIAVFSRRIHQIDHKKNELTSGILVPNNGETKL